jgi:hypothetical protein
MHVSVLTEWVIRFVIAIEEWGEKSGSDGSGNEPENIWVGVLDGGHCALYLV